MKKEMDPKLVRLLARSGLSERDLVNDAVSLYDYFLEHIEAGGSLPFVEKKDGSTIEIGIESLVKVYDRVQGNG